VLSLISSYSKANGKSTSKHHHVVNLTVMLCFKSKPFMKRILYTLPAKAYVPFAGYDILYKRLLKRLEHFVPVF